MFISVLAAALLASNATTLPPADQPVLYTTTGTTLSQGDPEWRDFQFAPGKTIGRKGCLIMSLYMVMRDMGYTLDLRTYLETLSNQNLIRADGNLYWGLAAAFPGITATRLPLSGAKAITAAAEGKEEGAGVMLQVRTPRNTLHWVVVVSVEGQEVQIRDPNGGVATALDERYGGTASVKGLAFVRRSMQS